MRKLIGPIIRSAHVDAVMACKFFPGPVSRIAGIYNALRSDTCPALLNRLAPSYTTV